MRQTGHVPVPAASARVRSATAMPVDTNTVLTRIGDGRTTRRGQAGAQHGKD